MRFSDYRPGQKVTYRTWSGAYRAFRVVRLCLGSFFGPPPALLVEYIDTRRRQYLSVDGLRRLQIVRIMGP